MIYGIGVDLIETARIEAACVRFGDRFARRILTERELERWNARRARSEVRGIAFLATRFAAKEAISKAFGTGIGKELGWHDMEVGRKESGEPYVILHDQGLRLLKQRGAGIVHLTLSHTEQHAVAMAILERTGEAP